MKRMITVCVVAASRAEATFRLQTDDTGVRTTGLALLELPTS